jgi:RNA polymerase sigma-70 factor (ECF subfamily)
VDIDPERTYQELRPLLFSIAYRMLGSVAEAEDVVQEAMLRLHLAAGTEDIRSPEAFAATLVTRLSIDQLRSARVRRERYFGSWLPEPLVGDPVPDVADHAETADSLSMAFLVLLETLSPVERAAFLLREVFAYPYREIAGILDRSEASCRQLVTRSRTRVEERKPRFEADKRQRDELAARFLAAAQEGDLDELVDLLAADVVFTGDGGGNVPPGAAVARPVHGREKVCRLLAAGLPAWGLDLHSELVQVNGQPGALFLDPEERLVSVLAFDIVDGRIQGLRSVVNPDKLRHLGPPADLERLMSVWRGGRNRER